MATGRPTGRPPLDRSDPSVKVNLTMPSKQYDSLYAEARKRQATIPEVIRDRLKCAYWPDEPDSPSTWDPENSYR
jgi:hypothetical protein